jgi:pyridinium-3,5-biscarboxylic acid mononucleotide synthase
MDEPELRQLLTDVAEGTCSPEEAGRRLRRLPFVDLGFARVDHHRALRQGLPEAVYGPGKTPAQCAEIVVELLGEPSGPVLLTRAEGSQADAADEAATRAGHGRALRTPSGSHQTLVWRPAARRAARVLVVTAGTADLPVAEECRAVLVGLGIVPEMLADCGVAGVHRLLSSADRLSSADAVVVVAGMEGALASLVGGVTGAPVVAVPTSAGYGAGLEGVTALLAMLASCAAGITVVGIDNGFGAACAVGRMLP